MLQDMDNSKLGEFVATRTYRGHGKDEKKSRYLNFERRFGSMANGQDPRLNVVKETLLRYKIKQSYLTLSICSEGLFRIRCYQIKSADEALAIVMYN